MISRIQTILDWAKKQGTLASMEWRNQKPDTSSITSIEPIAMNSTLDPSGQRTDQQIRDHYNIEKKLASQLKQASQEVRQTLYSELYETLYRTVPSHPMLTAKHTTDQREQDVAALMHIIKPFLRRDATFMEIGAGDCALSFEVAE